jgi:hypothetical protein
VEGLGHSLVVTSGDEVPLLSYCLTCGRYAEKTGQGLRIGCEGEPKNKMGKFRLKRMMDGKHPEDDRRLGGVVPGRVWRAGGLLKGDGLPWDVGDVQGASGSSGNFLAVGPCGAVASGSVVVGVEPCGAVASGSHRGERVGGPCGAGASGFRVLAGPCGAGASGSGGVWPWEPDGLGPTVRPEEEEVAAEWWGSEYM